MYQMRNAKTVMEREKLLPQGICGSGIIDLIAELFLEGWIDIRGKLSPEKSPLIQERDNQLCVEYAPGLYFYQKDIRRIYPHQIRRSHHGRNHAQGIRA